MDDKRGKTTRTSALARVAVVDPERMVASLFADTELRSLAVRFHGLRRDTTRHVVDVTLEMGGILQRARPRLKGLYHRWVREVLQVVPSTAYKHVYLTQAAEEEPDFVEEWKDLGIGKLYQLVRLKPKARQKVLRAPHLDRMNDRDFARLVRSHRGHPARQVTPRMRAHGMGMKLLSWTTQAQAFEVPELDVEDRATLRERYQRLHALLGEHLRQLK